MTPQDQHFLQQAIDLARANLQAKSGGPFGAVIVREGQILATGCNHVTTRNDPTAHAEVVAIRSACEAIGHYALTGCTLYASCEPCPMCLAAIYWARIDRLFYAATRHQAAEAGFDDEFLYRELVLPVPERSLPTQQGLEEAGAGVFAEWTALVDKVPY